MTEDVDYRFYCLDVPERTERHETTGTVHLLPATRTILCHGCLEARRMAGNIPKWPTPGGKDRPKGANLKSSLVPSMDGRTVLGYYCHVCGKQRAWPCLYCEQPVFTDDLSINDPVADIYCDHGWQVVAYHYACEAGQIEEIYKEMDKCHTD